MSAVLPAARPRTAWRAPPIGVETLAVVASLFFTIASNRSAWQHALDGRAWSDPATWRFAAALAVALTAFQAVLLALVLTRRTARVVLSLLIVATAFASHFMQTYNVYLDPTMLRSVLRTDAREAGELLTWRLAPHLLWQAALPLALLWRTPLVERPWKRALLHRIAFVAASLALFALALLAVFQDAAALARNHRDLRFLVAPSNYLYSLARTVGGDARAAARPLQPIGEDARLGPSWTADAKPVLLVIVVGETARAANWGLDGYARQTTPELAKIDDLLNFSDAQSCGTDTETSVPCMFSPWGRHDYDEARIRGHQSLLHVLARAGMRVSWRDNQSGCKGACVGLPSEQLQGYDEDLLAGLDRMPADGASRVIVLHQMGSHGPAYHARYPAAFRRFTPTCDTAELRECTPEQIVNAYDNSLLYTDHVVASAIALLKAQQARYDTALVYASDHGESLGEHNLFLHGMPRAIAPKEQTTVPMVMWLSPGMRERSGVDLGCLRSRAARPASHDNLFHTVLGLLDVRTALHDPAWDLAAGCRSSDQ
jgi:lipid A ethanolaminephosphotransferase